MSRLVFVVFLVYNLVLLTGCSSDTDSPLPMVQGSQQPSGSDSSLSDPDTPAPDASNPAAPDTTEPGQDNEDDALVRLLALATRAAGRPIIELNHLLREGRPLNDQQNQCIGGFEPALGQPLLSIDCNDQPLAVGEVEIYTAIAEFDSTDDCRAAVAQDLLTGCTLNRTRIIIPDTWTMPPVDAPGPQRPQPIAGADIDYRIDGEKLRLGSRPDSVTGTSFQCELDLVTGATNAQPPGSCGDIIGQIEQRLRQLLDTDGAR